MPQMWEGIEVYRYMRLVDENLFAYFSLITDESKFEKCTGDVYLTTFSNGTEEMLSYVK